MTIEKWLEALVGALVAVGAYFIGNINSAILLSRMKGKDIRKCGSGNPGTMNMIRTFGKPIGALTLVLDVLKGVVPSLLGWLFMGTGQFLSFGSDRTGLFLAGLCTELGHIYPVAMKFKGGKGVAVVLGTCLVSEWWIMLSAFAFGLLFLFVTKLGSLTSFIMMGVPLAAAGVEAASAPMSTLAVILIFCMFALTLFAHRSNLVKLFSGNERQVRLKKSKATEPGQSMYVLFDAAIAE